MKTKDSEANKPTGRSDKLSSGHGGPRTAQGKRRGKFSKHGIFSIVIVLKGESRAEYDSLLKGMRDSRQPQGMLEEVLVEKLATLLWRQKRFLQGEGAEIKRMAWTERRTEFRKNFRDKCHEIEASDETGC